MPTYASAPYGQSPLESVATQAPVLRPDPAPLGSAALGVSPILGRTGPAVAFYRQTISARYRIQGYPYSQRLSGRFDLAIATYAGLASGSFTIYPPSQVDPKHIPLTLGTRPLAVGPYLGTWSSERTYGQTVRGLFRQGNYPIRSLASGWHAWFGTFAGRTSGQYRVGLQRYVNRPVGAFAIENRFEAQSRGWHAAYNRMDARACGFYFLGLSTRTSGMRGWYAVGYANYAARITGWHRILRRYRHEDVLGRYRIANDSLRRYELFIGVDGEPDFTAPPAETFTTLPHNTAPLAPGHEYRLAVRLRNEYGLSSQNTDTWRVVVDAAGAEDTPPPSAPFETTAAPAQGGKIRIEARYNYLADGQNKADKWRIYLRADGTDPDPAVDTPVEIVMRQADGVAKLSYTTSAYADGTEVRALVRAYRTTAPAAESANTDIHAATANTAGPPEPVGVALFGKTAGVKH